MSNPKVQQLIDEHLENIAGVRNAVVLAADGMLMYRSKTDKETAERYAALASGVAGLADHVAAEEAGGAVERTLIEMAAATYVLVRCGSYSYLAVCVDRKTDLSSVGYALTLLARQLAPVLDAEQRLPVSGATP